MGLQDEWGMDEEKIREFRTLPVTWELQIRGDSGKVRAF